MPDDSRGIDRTDVRDRSRHRRARGRRAGAANLSRHAQAAGPRAPSSPVSEADHRRRRAAAGAPAGDLRRRLAVGGDRGRPRAIAARRGVGRRSDRRHARLSRGPRGLVDLGGAGAWTGRPIVAALYAPVTDELFLSIAGGGATRNGMPIEASAGDRPRRAREVCRRQAPARQSRGGRAAHRDDAAQSIRWRCGSRASRPARSMATFAGRNSHDWDLAAADLLVHEAGGLMTAL